MIDEKGIDFTNCATFKALYYSVTPSFGSYGPLSEDNALEVVYLGMRDLEGHDIEVPCTYVAAELIRLYPFGTALTLYVAPTVADNGVGDMELMPLVIGAVRAL